MKYKLIKKFYFPDGDYAEPQELKHKKGVNYVVKTKNSIKGRLIATWFIKSNTEFFERVEDIGATQARADKIWLNNKIKCIVCDEPAKQELESHGDYWREECYVEYSDNIEPPKCCECGKHGELWLGRCKSGCAKDNTEEKIIRKFIGSIAEEDSALGEELKDYALGFKIFGHPEPTKPEEKDGTTSMTPSPDSEQAERLTQQILDHFRDIARPEKIEMISFTEMDWINGVSIARKLNELTRAVNYLLDKDK